MLPTELANLDDEALARLASQGLRTAAEVLLERHTTTALAMACALAHNRDDALDAAQTALMRLSQELSQGWKGRPFKVCLCSQVHSAVVNLLAQESSRRGRENTVAQHNAQREAQMPGDPVEREEQVSVLRQELAALPTETAALLALYHLEGLSTAGVATQLNLTSEACQSRLIRARKELRGRLERRGIFLASLALTTELLDSTFSGGKAWAAAVSAPVKSQLLKKALAAGAWAAVSTLSSGTTLSTPTAEGIGTAATPPMLPMTVEVGGTRPGPVGRSMQMVRKHPMAVASGILAVLVLILALVFSVQTTAADQSLTSGSVLGTAKGGGVEPGAQATARSAPKWQLPHFIDGTYVIPQSIAMCGSRVAVLLADHRKQFEHAVANQQIVKVMGPDNSTPTLLLLESADGGRTWNESFRMENYHEGDLAIDADGSCSLVVTRTDYAASRDMALITRKGEGKFGDAQALWPAKEFAISPRAIHVAGGDWIFAKKRDAKKINAVLHMGPNMALEVAFAPTGGAPAALPQSRTVGNCERPCAWAADVKSAGYVLLDRDSREEQRLRHHFTADGGQSWQASDIPLAIDVDSGVAKLCVSPLALARDDRRLALFVVAQGDLLYPDSKDWLDQQFLLVSDDLGQTWSAPRPVTPRRRFHPHPDFPHTAEIPNSDFFPFNDPRHMTRVTLLEDNCRITLDGDTVRICFNAVLFVNEGAQSSKFGLSWLNKTATEILVSTDAGVTWRRDGAFAPFRDEALNVMLAGDSTRLHFLVRKFTGPALLRGQLDRTTREAALVIRSWAPGDWPAPKGPLPKWFKEERSPAATKEDF